MKNQPRPLSKKEIEEMKDFQKRMLFSLSIYPKKMTVEELIKILSNRNDLKV